MRQMGYIGTRGDSQRLQLWWAFNPVGLTKELAAAAVGLTVAVWLMPASKDGKQGDGNWGLWKPTVDGGGLPGAF